MSAQPMTSEQRAALHDALITENARVRVMLEIAAYRFEDIAKIVEQHGSYADAGFLRASAARCREALQ